MNRWRALLVAGAAALGAVACAEDDADTSAPEVTPTTTVESTATTSTVPPTTEPATGAPTTSTTAASTTAAPTTSVAALDAVELELRNGVTLRLPGQPARVRHLDTLNATELGARADYAVDLWFDDAGLETETLRVWLGRDVPRVQDRRPVPIGDREGWTVESASTAAVAVGVAAETIVELTASRRTDRPAEEARWSVDELVAIAETVVYDPAQDARLTSMATQPFALTSPNCADEVAVTGGGPDMVLFTCDGTLAIYDGETGERVELIAQFEDQRLPPPEEGSGSPNVDGIAMSPDRATVWYSTGPEPVSGNLFRYIRGSGAPELVAPGTGPAVSPDGGTVAVSVLDGIGLAPTDGTAPLDLISLTQMFPFRVVWSPDGARIAFEAPGGVVGVLDVATHDVALYASTVPGLVYEQPSFRPDGTLEAIGHCCDDEPGALAEFLVLGEPGNNPPVEGSGGDGVVLPLRRVIGPGGLATLLHGDRLGPRDAPWATGVLEAALLP